MTFPWYWCARVAYKEIEIRTRIRLKDVVCVKFVVAAVDGAIGRAPFGTATLQLLICNLKVQPATSHVELDHVAIPNLSLIHI